MRFYSVVLFIISGFLFHAFAAEIDMSKMTELEVTEACKKEALKFGKMDKHGNKIKTIHSECRKFIESRATSKLKASSKNGNISYVAGLNIIYFDLKYKSKDGKEKVITQIIAGEATKLDNIERISLSADSEWLGVIQSVPSDWAMDDKKDKPMQQNLQKEIRIFKAKYSGNMAPKSVFRHNDINDAVDLSFHPNGQEVFVVNEKKKHIAVYNLYSHYIRYNDKLKSKPLRKIKPSTDTFRAPASIDFMSDGSLLVLDKESNQILALDTNTFQKQWEIKNEDIGLNFLEDIDYDNSKKELYIFDDIGNHVSFQKD